MFVDILQTIAGAAATIAGFSGITFVLGGRASGSLSEKDKSGLFHLFMTSFACVLIPIILLALLAGGLEQLVVWRIGCALVGIDAGIGATRALIDLSKKQNSFSGLFGWLAPIIAIILVIVNLLVAIGLFPDIAYFVCIALLIWLLWVAIMTFLSLLVND